MTLSEALRAYADTLAAKADQDERMAREAAQNGYDRRESRYLGMAEARRWDASYLRGQAQSLDTGLMIG